MMSRNSNLRLHFVHLLHPRRSRYRQQFYGVHVRRSRRSGHPVLAGAVGGAAGHPAGACPRRHPRSCTRTHSQGPIQSCGRGGPALCIHFPHGRSRCDASRQACRVSTRRQKLGACPLRFVPPAAERHRAPGAGGEREGERTMWSASRAVTTASGTSRKREASWARASRSRVRVVSEPSASRATAARASDVVTAVSAPPRPPGARHRHVRARASPPRPNCRSAT